MFCVNLQLVQVKCWDGDLPNLTSNEASKNPFSTDNPSKSYTIGLKANTELH